MRVFIDIETIPEQNPNMDEYKANVKAPASYKKPESIQKWMDENADRVAEENWLKTSFDGGKGQICCICVSRIDSEIAKFYGDEKEILTGLNNWILGQSDFQFAKTDVQFIGHNVRQFDLPFLHKRLVINSVKPQFKTKWQPRHGNGCFDTMEEWAGYNGRISQDNLCKILGIESSKESMDGSQVWPEYQKGNIDKIADYCADDVRALIEIYKRLTWA